jgi:hypothetical protein
MSHHLSSFWQGVAGQLTPPAELKFIWGASNLALIRAPLFGKNSYVHINKTNKKLSLEIDEFFSQVLL